MNSSLAECRRILREAVRKGHLVEGALLNTWPRNYPDCSTWILLQGVPFYKKCVFVSIAFSIVSCCSKGAGAFWSGYFCLAALPLLLYWTGIISLPFLPLNTRTMMMMTTTTMILVRTYPKFPFLTVYRENIKWIVTQILNCVILGHRSF